MRVVAGEAKGRELFAPKTSATRPTSDKVRDAIFNVLAGSIEGAVVLDLFAGSGAMGIEALSRGADVVEMVESNRDALAAIRRNLEATKMQNQVTVWPMTVDRALGRLGKRFDIILADPPYAYDGTTDLLNVIAAGDVLASDGTVVLEHGKRFEPQESYGRLIRWQCKRYGDTSVSFYTTGDDST